MKWHSQFEDLLESWDGERHDAERSGIRFPFGGLLAEMDGKPLK